MPARPPMADHHSVFAVCDTPLGKVKVAVSATHSWSRAVDRWNALDDRRLRGEVTVRGFPVSHFAVRSGDDPAWPTITPGRARNGRAKLLVQDERGRFV
jgi:hypothetical protein